MGLFEKKQALGGKEVKKEPKPSVFGGRSFLRRQELRGWLRKEEARRVTKMSQKERVGLEKKLFEPKKFGELIKPKEAERVYKEIKNFPRMSKEKYGLKSKGERFKTLKILEKLLGK